MSAVDIAQIAGAIFIGLGVIIALFQVLLTQANERRRMQPLVVTHENRGRNFSADTGWEYLAHATNEGEGAAFNVRFGVSVYGVLFAFRLDEGDAFSGNRQRVIHPRESVPEAGAWQIRISSLELWGGEGVPEESTFYWARYENAQGKTWETRNWPERSKHLLIRRRRFIRFRERWEDRKRARLDQRGRARETEAVAELLQRRDQ